MTNTKIADWIAVDWGTTNVRAWAMSAENKALDVIRSDKGMKSLSSEQYEDVLLSLIKDWWDGKRPINVIICGMAGAKSGWIEAPYRFSDDKTDIIHFMSPNINTPNLNVKILAGLAQRQPADVMRGEETQLSGFLTSHPNYTGAICCPGTHSKWVEIKDSHVTTFQSYMTGEIFDLLVKQSILSLSLSDDGWDDEIAQHTIENLDESQGNLGRYFSLRASDMMGSRETSVQRRTQLSIWVIADEIRDFLSHTRPLKINLIGAGSLTKIYADIIKKFGYNAMKVDPVEVTLTGLISAYTQLSKENS